jgi:hypothetical protein
VTKSRKVLVVVAGLALWLLAVGICWQVSDHRLTTVLMPLWRPLLALAGRAPNIGTPEDPAYEATPVHAIFALTGIGLSALVYIGLLWTWVAWRRPLSS